MQTFIRRGAMALLCVLALFTAAVVGQSTISTFTKVRITSTASDALSLSGGVTAAGQFISSTTAPQVIWTETDQTAEERNWLQLVEGKTFGLYPASSALVVGSPAWTVTRGAGTALTGMTITPPLTLSGALTGNANASFVGTAGTTLIDPNGTAFSNYNTLRLGAGASKGSLAVFQADAASRWQVGVAPSTTFLAFTVPGVGEKSRLTTDGQWLGVDGSVSAPTYGFASAPTTGFYLTSGQIAWGVGGVQGGRLGSNGIGIGGGALGTGAVSGGTITVGRNSSGSGAAACLLLQDRTGTGMYLYADSNLLRYNIYSDGCPTENNVGPHSGTVIGTQTSTAESKYLLGQPKNTDLLAAVLRTKVHEFTYRDGRWNGETFTGIVTDESPWFGMDRDAAHPAGKALNDINGLGYTVGAIKALHAELAELRAEVKRLKRRR